MTSPSVLISVGELSGDRIGGLLARALRCQDPEVRLVGLGGPAMHSSGVQLWAETTHVGVVGLFEAISRLPEIIRLVRLFRHRVRQERPNVALLISCEGLNVPLGWYLRRLGVPTVAYFPPQVWMWRRFAGNAGRFFDLVLSAFPEEDQVYRKSRARVEFVGHYLKDDLLDRPIRNRIGSPQSERPCFALLPGSRRREFAHYAPVLLDTAAVIESMVGPCRFLLPLASSDFLAETERMLRSRNLADRIDCELSSREAMSRADVGLVASGTASLEAALLGLPFILFYRLSAGTYWLTRGCQKVGLITDDWLGLPNLIAGRQIVPEFYQSDVRPRRLAEEAVSLWQDPERRARMRADFGEISGVLGDGRALEKVAGAVLKQGRC